MTKKVVVVPGDDAMPEAMLPTADILRSMNLELDIRIAPTGKEAIEKLGANFAEEAQKAFQGADAMLRGSMAQHLTGPGSTRHVMSYMRRQGPFFAAVRPFRWLKGFNSPLKHPEGIDYLMVREQQEDVYRRLEGPLSDLAVLNLDDPHTGQKLDTVHYHGYYLIKVITEERTRKTAEFGCQLALKRKERGWPGRVTVVSKARLFLTDGLFRDVVMETAKKYDLWCEWLSVDNFCNQMVINPHQFDVVIITNQFGDILSDGAGAVIGGLGVCPSGIYGDGFASFGPIHGTAPDIAGKNIINPTSSILSAKMMLQYLNMDDEAERLERAVAKVYEDGRVLTPDQGGKASTTEFCAAVKRNL